ncbi:MAG TPA: hypothetical protein VIU85_04070 [Chthoniobacterales bacterium]
MKTLKAEAFNKHADKDNRGLKRMQAKLIYLFGDAETIESLGKFLCECAKEMRGRRPFHLHFQDFDRKWKRSILDIVVERPDKRR